MPCPPTALTGSFVDLPRREVPDGLPPVLGPRHFELHTCPGTPVAFRAATASLVEVGFRPDDPDLGGRVLLDFSKFDWVEEDQPITGHAHDPYKRIDVLRSDRHVVVELDGTVLADSRRAMALYETFLPTRWYLPREDVRMDLLTPSDTHTVCAYKGQASYLSADLDGGADIAWFYPEPARRRRAGPRPRRLLVRALGPDRGRRAGHRRHARRGAARRTHSDRRPQRRAPAARGAGPDLRERRGCAYIRGDCTPDRED